MQRKKALKINLKNKNESSLPIGRRRFIALAILGCVLSSNSVLAGSQERLLPAGRYMPFFSPRRAATSKNKTETEPQRNPVEVRSFWMDTYPVTNGEFLKFVQKNFEWRRSKISRVFADESYLKHWKSDLKLKTSSDLNRPVTQVSWFAANAYCQSLGRDLPTTDQWEYAIDDAGRNSEDLKQTILTWYSSPNSKSLPKVGLTAKNSYGIHDLIGVIWEWTIDFNSTMLGSELRNSGTKDEDLFCGAGSLNAQDASDYAKFMRYSFRGSLKAEYTTANLGFRCAREANQ